MKVKPSRWIALTLIGLLTTVTLSRRPEETGEYSSPAATGAQPDGWPATIPLRLITKHQLIREVVEGRRSLVEAATLFRELDRVPPVLPTLSDETFDRYLGIPHNPSRSDDERRCWQIYTWARSTLAKDMPGREACLAQMNAAIRELLQGPNPFRLPDPRTRVSARELLAQTRRSLSDAEWRSYFGRTEEKSP